MTPENAQTHRALAELTLGLDKDIAALRAGKDLPGLEDCALVLLRLNEAAGLLERLETGGDAEVSAWRARRKSAEAGRDDSMRLAASNRQSEFEKLAATEKEARSALDQAADKELSALRQRLTHLAARSSAKFLDLQPVPGLGSATEFKKDVAVPTLGLAAAEEAIEDAVGGLGGFSLMSLVWGAVAAGTGSMWALVGGLPSWASLMIGASIAVVVVRVLNAESNSRSRAKFAVLNAAVRYEIARIIARLDAEVARQASEFLLARGPIDQRYATLEAEISSKAKAELGRLDADERAALRDYSLATTAAEGKVMQLIETFRADLQAAVERNSRVYLGLGSGPIDHLLAA